MEENRIEFERLLGMSEKLSELKRLTEERVEEDEEYSRLMEQKDKGIFGRRKRGKEILKEVAVSLGLCSEEEKPFEYKLFVSSKKDETSEATRVRYIQLTKDLIEKIISRGADSIVFLDKSARPVYWLVDEFWELFAKDRPRPDFKFVNIDKTAWNPIVGTNEEVSERSNMSSNINVRRAPEALIKLRKLFSKPDGSTYFDRKKVMVVDEVKSSGDTLEISRQFFTEAFPEADVSVWYWMKPSVVIGRDGVRRNEESPFWYRREDSKGRGVDDPFQSSDFLSRRPKEKDILADQLRKEVRKLGEEVRKGLHPWEYFY